MLEKSIETINEKIKNNEANIFTIDEFKKLVKNDNAPSFEEVDVVTCGTCGVMSGTAAVFNLTVSEPGLFRKAKNIFLNDIPGNVGPCPNEWLGSVDLILNGTSRSQTNPNYGGGFLFKDLLENKDISVKVESIDGEIYKTKTNLDKIARAEVIGTRMAFKNYTAFTNPSNESVKSIFTSQALDGNYSKITFSGCGELNPLENDPDNNVIKKGTSLLLNDSEGIVIGEGTRSSKEKRNLMVSANMKNMNPEFIGGFKTSEGPEIYNTIAIPIAVLNEEIYNNLFIINEDIDLNVADIKGRHLPIAKTNYSQMWDNHDVRPKFNKNLCTSCNKCKVEEVCPTEAFKDKNLDMKKCFGCGVCIYNCPNNAFEMNIGKANLKVDNKELNIPIYSRQSDTLRAKKLSYKLKLMIKERKFLLK